VVVVLELAVVLLVAEVLAVVLLVAEVVQQLGLVLALVLPVVVVVHPEDDLHVIAGKPPEREDVLKANHPRPTKSISIISH